MRDKIIRKIFSRDLKSATRAIATFCALGAEFNIEIGELFSNKKV